MEAEPGHIPLYQKIGPASHLSCSRKNSWRRAVTSNADGLRGSHPGSFELAHKLRDGNLRLRAPPPAERYDLVIVGGGISGLSAAYFYRERKPSARILVLDNHDDFGGHARRNEFEVGGKMELINGGTLEIDSPRPYSVVAARLLRELGVDPVKLDAACTQICKKIDAGAPISGNSYCRESGVFPRRSAAPGYFTDDGFWSR